MKLTNTIGASLLMGLAFSLTLFTSASLISSAITQAQKNVRNIEDINIAFYAAESGIEEALYFNSFHKKGFEAANDPTANFQGYTKIESNIPNIGYTWNVSSRINSGTTNCPSTDYESTNDLCRGELLFGKSAVVNFSYDGNTSPSDTDPNNEKNTDPTGSIITFSYNNTAYPSPSNSNLDLATVNWLASYISTDGTESKLLAHHDADTSNLGNKPEDCMETSPEDDGKFICRNEVIQANSLPLQFKVAQSFAGLQGNTLNCLIGSNCDISSPPAFFNPLDVNQTWRKLKFFYINLIPGNIENTDPSLGSIRYTITPPSNGEDITATRTKITAEGRSRNILSNLDVTFDNTEEISALDYGVLLE